jgi:mono/diheme cytochrome c family protein
MPQSNARANFGSHLCLTAAILLSVGAIALASDGGGSATAGRALYFKDGCVYCHGGVGQGGAAPPLVGSLFPIEAFAWQVRNPSNEMPPYTKKVLSDQQLADIYAFVKTLKP